MKLLSTVAAGVLLLAGCAPFQHGHYESDAHYINDVGDPAGTPIVTNAGHYDDHYYEAATYSEPVYTEAAPVVHQGPIYSEPVPAVHSAPIYSEPAPVVHHHVEHAPAPVYVQPAPPPVQIVAAPPPPVQVIAPASQPTVVATTVNAAPEHYRHETVYAPPAVINAPPVFVRNGQMSSQPFPEPPYPSFGAPVMPGYGGFSVPAPGYGGFSSPVGGMIPSSVRPASGTRCVTQCSDGSTTVF